MPRGQRGASNVRDQSDDRWVQWSRISPISTSFTTFAPEVLAYTCAMQSQLRITLIDAQGTVSFGAPGYWAKMIAAACGHNPTTLDHVLTTLGTLDPETTELIRLGLAVFDEFVLRDDASTVETWLAQNDPTDGTPFRLIDTRLREPSLTPLPLGVVMVNLPDKRIVQIENRYGPLLRADRGRMRRHGEPIGQIYRYTLPAEWALLP
jgi:hypothetical protein